MLQTRPHTRLRRSALAAACVATLAAASPATALDVTWLGGNGAWLDAARWNTRNVPNDTAAVVFIDGGLAGDSAVQLAGFVELARLSIGSGDALAVRGGGGFVVYGGLIENNGSLSFAGDSVGMYLRDNTVLSGSGQTVLSGGSFSSFTIHGNGHSLSIASGHTLRGAGQIGGFDINLVNRGLLAAEGGNLTVSLSSGGTFDNAGGRVTVASGAALGLLNGTMSGGSLTGAGDARLMGGGTFADLALGGTLTVNGGNTIAVAGTLTGSGSLRFIGSGASGFANASLAADTTLAGAGETILGGSDSSGYTAIWRGNGHTLTIASGHTLRGAGYIGDSDIGLVNEGTLRAEGGNLIIRLAGSNPLDNRSGTIQLADDGTLQLLGTMSLSDASRLVVDVAGLSQFGQLSYNGNASFDGQVLLDLSGYSAQVGDSFSFISYAGLGSGLFDAVQAPGYTLSVSYANQHVTATITGVTAVPEPASWALLLSGLALLGLRARQSTRSTKLNAAQS